MVEAPRSLTCRSAIFPPHEAVRQNARTSYLGVHFGSPALQLAPQPWAGLPNRFSPTYALLGAF